MLTLQNPTDAANKSYVDANAGSGNLSSPPPIGNTQPNTVSATTLSAQNANGVLNAAAYAGSDVCAKMNAATSAAIAAGISAVSGEGFAGDQTCANTLNVATRIRYVLPAGTWTFNGNRHHSRRPGCDHRMQRALSRGAFRQPACSPGLPPHSSQVMTSVFMAQARDGLRVRAAIVGK